MSALKIYKYFKGGFCGFYSIYLTYILCIIFFILCMCMRVNVYKAQKVVIFYLNSMGYTII